MRSDSRPSLAAPFLIISGLLALQEIAVRAALVSPLIVAAPSQIVESIPLLIDENIVERAMQTFTETLLSTLIAVSIGVPVGFALATSARLDAAYRGWIAVIASAPLILMYPLFLVAFGRNMGTVVAIGAVSALPPIILKTRDGFVEVKKVYLDVGRSFGFTEMQKLRYILLPAATPSAVNGLRLAIIFALVNVVAVEFIINYGGLGFLVGEMADRYEVPAMYGAIFTLIAISAIFYSGTERIERWLRPF